jgi:hypothetical protein
MAVAASGMSLGVSLGLLCGELLWLWLPWGLGLAMSQWWVLAVFKRREDCLPVYAGVV